MPIYLFATLTNLFIEAYAFDVLIFLGLCSSISYLRGNLSSLLNAINFTGLLLALLALCEQGYWLFRKTSNNYQNHWLDMPFWHFFRYLACASFLSAIVVFVNGKRRRSIAWTLIGMFFLIIPFLSGPFEKLLNSGSIGKEVFIPWQLFVFSQVDIWSKLLVLAIPLCVVFIIWSVRRKLGFA